MELLPTAIFSKIRLAFACFESYQSNIYILLVQLWFRQCFFIGQFCRERNIEMSGFSLEDNAHGSTDSLHWWREGSYIYWVGMLSFHDRLLKSAFLCIACLNFQHGSCNCSICLFASVFYVSLKITDGQMCKC